MENYKLQITNYKQIPITEIPMFKTRLFRSLVIGSLVIICNLVLGAWNLSVFCQDIPSSKELIEKAWEAHGKRDVAKTLEYTSKCIELYKEEADRQQRSLKEMPKEGTSGLQELNDVAVAYFIQGEVYMRKQQWQKAKEAFDTVVKNYYYAWGWDPRGWYWNVAEVSRQSIDKIEEIIRGKTKEEEVVVPEEIIPIVLHDPGDDIVNYEKYGEFKNVGTKDYEYVVKDQEGLALAAGEGIYPNTSSHRFNPDFSKAIKTGKVKQGLHWDYVNSADLQTAFFNWIIAPEPAGIKLFYIGSLLEKSGLIKHALKAYYAIVVHFPRSYGWTYWHTPWYVGQAAISKIEFILRNNPQLNLKLEGADIKIINGFDNDVSNDIFIVNPGRFVKLSLKDKLFSRKTSAEDTEVKRRVGRGKVRLVQYKNGHWQLLVDDEPYMIKGVTYSPTKVGQSPDEGTLGNWMFEDFNQNGKIDGPYDAFVDKNRNNKQDKDEPNVGDFQLMKDMGVNTIRLYHHPHKVNKELLRAMYKKYGIMVIMGDFLGKYTMGSGAEWVEGTDYTNPVHKKNMLRSVREMVEEFKDEPYILMWLLGNENVYGVACNANTNPKAFFKFANEAARLIKSLDKNHPVALCNGDTLFLDVFAKNSSDIDIFGANAYRGNYGFGFLWKSVRGLADKPAFITEYGCPAYANGKTYKEAEELQAAYHRGCWEDIRNNMAFEEGEGNALGGVIFEWVDEWWKAYEPFIHDKKGLFTGPFPDGYMHEEWLGICGQGDGSLSPYLRHLRKSYFLYQELWLRDRPWKFKGFLQSLRIFKKKVGTPDYARRVNTD